MHSSGRSGTGSASSRCSVLTSRTASKAPGNPPKMSYGKALTLQSSDIHASRRLYVLFLVGRGGLG